jgi:hypothetical protein
MGTAETIKGLDFIVDLLSYFDPEIGILAREGVLFAKELIEQGVPDAAAEIRKLRAQVRSDWRAALAAKFNPGG